MKFEQTKVFHDLVQHFTQFANSHKYDEGREAMAERLCQGFAKMHGAERIAQVAKKANQKLKVKFYVV